MPYDSNVDPINYRQWISERVYSVRQAVSNWTKWRPVDVTLTTAGTAQNLYAITVDTPTANSVTNPSFETGTTSWTAVGSAIAQDATQFRTGANSLSINPDNAAAGEGAFFSLGTYPQSRPLTISAYGRRAAGGPTGGQDFRVELRDSAGTTTLATGNTVNLSTTWTRSVATVPPAGGGGTGDRGVLRLYVVTATNHNIDFFIDSIQAEIQGSVTDYVDGSLGLESFWLGTAHASMSQRFRSIGLITGYRLYNTRDIYITFDDVTASSTTGELVRAATDFHSEHPVAITSRISFINAVTGETPRVFGSLWGTPDNEDS